MLSKIYWLIVEMVFCCQQVFCPTVRKKCSSDREKLLKFVVESRESLKILRSLGQFIQADQFLVT